MVERRRRKIDHVRPVFEQAAGQLQPGVAGLGAMLPQRPDDALGPAGGARGIAHQRAQPLLIERARRHVRQRRRQVGEAVDAAAERQPDRAGLRHQRAQFGAAGDRGRGDQRPRIAVLDDIGRLRHRHVPVDRGQVEARAHAGPDRHEAPGAVVAIERDMVAASQPLPVEQLRQPVRFVVELAIAQRFAGGRADHRRLVGKGPRVRPWIHGCSPRSRSSLF